MKEMQQKNRIHPSPPLAGGGKIVDLFVMVAAALLIVYWGYRAFYNWLHQPRGMKRLVLGRGELLEPDDAHVLFLESRGYEVLSGKHKVPIAVELDGQELYSRLYIDYVAECDGLMYAVKISRERQPMDWTGSGLRDRLLVFSLLMPELEGILVVDPAERSIRTVKFDLEDTKRPRTREA